MVSEDLLAAKFAAGLGYGAYVETGKPQHREAWAAAAARVKLTETQRQLIGSFTRRINILVLSGTWCGDCVAQCPMLAAIAAANPERIDLRFLDRDEHVDLAEQVKICGGLRVPTVIYMNEDHEFVSLLGDRTLARYRAMAAKQLGAACPLPGAEVPAEEVAATLQDWVDETERVHLLLRLSPKLRERYGD
jgi:thiol-disulfide isomerase/thioredoxin